MSESRFLHCLQTFEVVRKKSTIMKVHFLYISGSGFCFFWQKIAVFLASNTILQIRKNCNEHFSNMQIFLNLYMFDFQCLFCCAQNEIPCHVKHEEQFFLAKTRES